MIEEVTSGWLRRFAIAFLAIALIVGVVCEAAARWAVSLDALPRQTYLVPGDRTLESKLVVLADWAAAGPADCILIGPSTVQLDVAPRWLSNRLFELTAFRPRCFNLGVAGMDAETTWTIIDHIQLRYAPTRILLGLSPLELTTDFGNAFVASTRGSPTMRTLRDEITPAGWLVQHSVAVGTAVALMRTPTMRSVPDNYDGFDGYDGSIAPAARANAEDARRVRSAYGPLRLIRRKGAALDAGLRRHPNVIVFETPVHPLPLRNDGVTYAALRDSVAALVTRAGSRYVSPQGFYGDELWTDFVHLNQRGSALYTSRLAEALALQPVMR